ncbi:MAG TPA: DUF2461 domain-containing protein [Acidimicrobiia bacterium]|nr:DUF2461 domain-containing protein [Acidimicrobiia bacterium]
MTFRGWPAEAIEFYEGLEADNTRAYWQDHKKEYEELVRRPMTELLAELAGEFGEGKIFRPYRDVRFARDKSPYKTAIGATLERGGYVQFSAHGLAAGSGYYGMMPDQLDRYRRAVDDDKSGAELAALVARLRKAGVEITAKDTLKTAPKGYAKDHPRIELLRHKGLIAWKQWPVAAWMGTAKAKQRVVAFLTTARPLTAWLDTHVGPSSLPSR